MRPVGQRLSGLRFPLDELLGSSANIRVLRVLVAAAEPYSYAQLAERTRLTWSGARVAAANLEKLGAVSLVGAGRRKRVVLREGFGLGPAIRALFEVEAHRVGHLERDLKDVLGAVRPSPMAAWVHGSIARGTDEIGEPVGLALLAKGDDIDSITDTIEAELGSLERRYDVLIHLEPFTRADLRAQPTAVRDAMLSEVWSLYGPHPLPLVEPGHQGNRLPRSHKAHDARSQARGAAVATLLLSSPDLIERARRHLDAKLVTSPARVRRDLAAWHRILAHGSAAQVRTLLSSCSERATRLRQSMPFFEVMTEAERAEVLRLAEKKAES